MGRKLIIFPPMKRDDDMEMRYGGRDVRYDSRDRTDGMGWNYTDGREDDTMRMGGRRRGSDGRYMSMSDTRRYDDSPRMGVYYPPYMGGDDYGSYEMRYNEPRYPEMRYPYHREMPRYDSREREDTAPRMTHKIGFSVDGEMERIPGEVRHDQRMDVGYQPMMNEMDSRRSTMQKGYSSSDAVSPFNRQTAKQWLDQMQNEDGTHGPHWSFDQVKTVMAQKGIQCDPAEFWAALNMVYSDYCGVAKKHGLSSNLDFYVDMAKAFLDDSDAQPDKIARYYEYVVQ